MNRHFLGRSLLRTARDEPNFGGVPSTLDSQFLILFPFLATHSPALALPNLLPFPASRFFRSSFVALERRKFSQCVALHLHFRHPRRWAFGRSFPQILLILAPICNQSDDRPDFQIHRQ